MTRQAYAVTLWRKGRWYQAGEDQAVIEDEQLWLDLQDETGTLRQISDLIRSRRPREQDITRYYLDVTDVATGDVIARIVPADLAAARAEQLTPRADAAPGALSTVSDEVLVRELLRRLTRH